MTKLEEILSEKFKVVKMNGDPSEQDEDDLSSLKDAIETGVDYDTLLQAMREYAEFYAEEFRNKIQKDMIDMPSNGYGYIIHQCKLPEHE